MSNGKIAWTTVGVVLVAGVIGWISTAPYLSNEGLGRTPGVIMGGTLIEPPSDFTPLNDLHRGPLMMKQAGFPPPGHLSVLGWYSGWRNHCHPTGWWLLGTTRAGPRR